MSFSDDGDYIATGDKGGEQRRELIGGDDS